MPAGAAASRRLRSSGDPLGGSSHHAFSRRGSVMNESSRSMGMDSSRRSMDGSMHDRSMRDSSRHTSSDRASSDFQDSFVSPAAGKRSLGRKLPPQNGGDAIFRMPEAKEGKKWPSLPLFGGSEEKEKSRRSGDKHKKKSRPKMPSATPK